VLSVVNIQLIAVSYQFPFRWFLHKVIRKQSPLPYLLINDSCLLKHLDKYLNKRGATKKIFHQKAFGRYILATKKRCLAIRACVCATSVAILLTNRNYRMQNLFTAHSLKTGLRLIVVVLLSFILVNLLS
jgi:hypothetical protein